MNTVLNGFPLSSAPGWVDVLLIIVLGVAVPLASIWVRPLISIGIAVALGIVFAIFVQLMFNGGWVVSFVYPLGALVLSAIGALAVQLITEAFERIRTVDLFARFVPEDVVDEVLKSADGSGSAASRRGSRSCSPICAGSPRSRSRSPRRR